MADYTKERKTDKFNPDDTVLPTYQSFPALAAVTYYAGGFGGVNGAGFAVSATDGATKLVGRVEKQVDNSAGANGAKTVDVRPGVYFWDNGTNAITQAYFGLACYAESNYKVGYSSVSGKYPYAGIVLGLTAAGQVAVLSGYKSCASPATDYTMRRGYVRGVCDSNVTLTAFTGVAGGSAVDGITYVAGDVVLLVGQTLPAQNGPYMVGTVATGSAPLTRVGWWALGMPIPRGAIIEVSGQGTVYGGASYKSFVTTATKLVGTDSPKLFARVVAGTKTLSGGAGTVASLSITTQAIAVASENTANKSSTIVLTAGADQTGQIVFAGTTTSVVKYQIYNW
jgi:hypothetical protein